MIRLLMLWMDEYSLKLIGKPMIQVSSFLCTLIMMQSQRISSPKDCGENYHKQHLPPPNGVLKDCFDTGQIEDGFSNSKSIKGLEVHTLYLTLNTMKVATINLLNAIMGRNLCNLHSAGRKAQVSSLPKQRGVTEFSQQNWVYPNP